MCPFENFIFESLLKRNKRVWSHAFLSFQYLALSILHLLLCFLCLQVPVRVAGGLLFELLGQSAGDPFVEEDDIPVVLRSWQAQNYLLTVLHVKGSASRINVLGITEVQVCDILIDPFHRLTCSLQIYVVVDSAKIVLTTI